ncbi:hypothetical protein [Bdellovibrio sp. HCB337]|uniref:hypothetical protein n=1 Tax=Bdellovibrio sp. HCB337 TaxID=3394358 RepID=UPI0039A470A1
MKSFVTTLAFFMAFTVNAKAADCVSVDGVVIPDGASAKFYYTANPSKDMGPSYTCGGTSRVRTCTNGQLSNNVPECSQYDSGGCVDYWMDRLADSDFSFAVCAD